MGTWSEGVFANDHALDLLSVEIDSLVESIEDTLGLEDLAFDDIEGPLIYVHLLGLIAKEASVDVSPARVAGWRATYLAAFDATTAKGSYATKRRAVIVKTFATLAKHVDGEDDEAPARPAKKPKSKAKSTAKAKAKAKAKRK